MEVLTTTPMSSTVAPCWQKSSIRLYLWWNRLASAMTTAPYKWYQATIICNIHMKQQTSICSHHFDSHRITCYVCPVKKISFAFSFSAIPTATCIGSAIGAATHLVAALVHLVQEQTKSYIYGGIGLNKICDHEFVSNRANHMVFPHLHPPFSNFLLVCK